MSGPAAKKSTGAPHPPLPDVSWDLLPPELLLAILACAPEKTVWRARRLDKRTRDAAAEALKAKLELDGDQLKAVMAALRGESIVLVGAAGSGKTHVLKALRARLPKGSTFMTASTGAAAELIRGTTTHSALGIGVGKLPLPALIAGARYSAAGMKVRACMRRLVIDECPMLSKELLTKIVGLVDALKGSLDWQLILVGDVLQLQPVNAKVEGHMFEAAVLCDRVTPYVLRGQHRQAGDDAAFLDILTRARVGCATEGDLQYLQENCAPAGSLEGATRLCSRNVEADAINAASLAALPGRATTYHAFDAGDARAADKLSVPKELTLKVGARVMLLKNQPAIGKVNGSLGEVVHLDDSEVVVKFDKDGKEFGFGGDANEAEDQSCQFECFDRDGKVIATRWQLPFRPAYAISIHKSQGATLEKVECDFARIFAPGQAYVALSRVRQLAHIAIDNLDLRKLNLVCRPAIAWLQSIGAA